jgi:hypothetical protein
MGGKQKKVSGAAGVPDSGGDEPFDTIPELILFFPKTLRGANAFV